MELQESPALNLPYESIVQFAAQLEETQIATLPSINDAISLFGGKIKEVSLDTWSRADFSFVSILGENDFEIYLCDTFPKEMKKFLIIQALGHYILHSASGLKPCKVNTVAKSPASREGIVFALSVLLPDRLTKPLIEVGTSDLEIANYFKVLPEMVLLKKKFSLK